MSRSPDTSSGRAQVLGAEISYEAAGQGQPLVLIHAGIADCRMWDEQFDAIAHHFRVIRYDLRGVGRSSMPAGAFSHHNDLKGLLKFLNLERAHVVGLSMGGSVAIDFALTHPEMVDKLVLAAVLGPPPFSQGLRDGWSAAEAAFETEGLSEVNEIEMQMWVDGPARAPGDVDPEVRAFVAAMNIDVLRREEESECVPETLDPPAATRLADIAAPTLVIVGTGDQPDVLTYCGKLATEIPNARLELITDVAHMVNMEASDRFTELVVNFVAGKL